MKIFFTLLTVFIYNVATAQNVNFKWAKQMGGADLDIATAVAVDANGNVYSTGFFQDTADFDPNSGYAPLYGPPYLKRSCFISKLDSLGNFVWAKQFKGECTGYSIKVDANSNVYISGTISDTVDFDPGNSSYKLYSASSNYDGFIAKIDSSGKFAWANLTGLYDYYLTTDNQANVYTFGKKYDSWGNLIWDKKINSYDVFIKSLTIDDSDNVYYAGRFDAQYDFDPDSGTYMVNPTKNNYGSNTTDMFIWKFDSSGKFVWVKQIGGVGDDIPYSVCSQGNSICYIGLFSDTVDFDPSSSVYNLSGLMAISKLNTNGDFIWAKSYNAPASWIFPTNDGYGIASDKFSNVYITGNFYGGVDFNPDTGVYILSSYNTHSCFVSKLDSSAKFIWAKHIGTFARYIAADDNENVYTTGVLSATSDMDPSVDTFNLTPSGYSDIYVHKMSPCLPSSSTITITACDGYKIKYNTYTKTGTYYETIANAKGCDSSITLNLTIKYSSGFFMAKKACTSYTFNGNILTKSGTYYDTIPNAVGCDSIVTLKLTINNPSSSSITDKGCNRYYFNGALLTSSGIYYDTVRNSVGCDSIIKLNLTINNSNVITITKSACDSFVFNGTTLNKSGIYSSVLTNQYGCDSNVILTLTIGPLHNYIIENACTWYYFNGAQIKASGRYYDTLINSTGCDSIITLDLTITNVNTAVSQNGLTLMSAATAASYQWLECSSGYKVITGATNQNYTVTQNGAYAVAIMQNNCYDTSNCYTVTNQGISDKNILYTFDVFPNPTNGQFTVRSSQTLNNVSIKLYNITGQLVLQKTNLSGESFVLDISEQANGIYMMVIGEGLNVSRVKVVKAN